MTGPEDTRMWYQSQVDVSGSVGQARRGGAPLSVLRPRPTSVATCMAPSARCDWAQVLPAPRTAPGQSLQAQQNGRHLPLLPNEVRRPGKATWGPGQPQMAPAALHRPGDRQEAECREVWLTRDQRQFEAGPGGGSSSAGLARAHRPWNACRQPGGLGGLVATGPILSVSVLPRTSHQAARGCRQHQEALQPWYCTSQRSRPLGNAGRPPRRRASLSHP